MKFDSVTQRVRGADPSYTQVIREREEHWRDTWESCERSKGLMKRPSQRKGKPRARGLLAFPQFPPSLSGLIWRTYCPHDLRPSFPHHTAFSTMQRQTVGLNVYITVSSEKLLRCWLTDILVLDLGRGARGGGSTQHMFEVYLRTGKEKERVGRTQDDGHSVCLQNQKSSPVHLFIGKWL